MGLPQLVPLDVLFGNPERRSPQLSPDGSRLAYLAPAEGVLNVWVGAVGGDSFTPVTDDRGRGIQWFFWAKDNRHLLFLRDTGGDENWHLHTVDLETGEIVDRTPFDGVQATVLGRSPRVPDQVLVGVNRDDPRYHDVYRLDLRTGELTKEITNPGFDGWLVDHELVVRGAVRPRADGGVDYLFRSGDDWGVGFAVDPDDFVINITGPLRFTGDNRRVWFSSVQGSDTARLVTVDLESGDFDVVAEHPDRDLVWYDVVLHPRTAEAQLVPFATDRFEYRVVDQGLAGDLQALREASTGDLKLVSRDDDDRVWLVVDIHDSGPARYSLWDRSARRLTFLFKDQPALAGYELASMEPFSFVSRDGLTVHGFLTFPPGVERRGLPAVVHVHGGPWGARHDWGYTPDSQWLANRGYACIEVDYRGSGGYGKSFLNASAREWAGRMHDDLVDALEYTIEQGWVDRDRVGIFGGSYGGYAALVGATFTPDVFRCAVDYVGPSNLITLLESIPPYWFGVAKQFDKLLGNPERDRDFLWERSPLSRVDDIRIPLFIAQGANDPRVKQAESEQIVEALVKRGVEHEYLLFPDEGHGFVRPENRTRFYRAVEQFLARYLGGRAEPGGSRPS